MGVLRANVAGTWVDVGQSTDVRVWNGAWGIVAQSKIIAPQSGVSTTDTLLTSSALGVATIAGRRYKFSINASPLPDAGSTGAVWYKLRLDSSPVGGRTCTVTDPNTSQQVHIEYTHTETVTGNRTFDVTIARLGGSGTVGNNANATLPTWVTVEDMGPTAVTVLPPQPLVANPGNALGIIAVGSPVSRAGALITTTAENLGPPINCYTQVGRRYRFVVNGVRASTHTTGGYYAFYLTGPGITGRVDWYRLTAAAYDSLNAEVVFDGQGSIGTYTVQIVAGAASGTNVWTEPTNCGYYIEDCGPSTPVGIADITPLAAVPWTGLPFGAGWANYGGYEFGQYRKIGDMVYLRGLILASAGVTATIATLPVGYRPTTNVINTVLSSQAPTAATLRLDINAAGALLYNSFVSGQWVNLSNIQFSVTA